jgi:hypothetical protein
MSTERDRLTNPERRLPDLDLPSIPGGEPRPIRTPGRRSPVLVLAHGPDCVACNEFIRQLHGEKEALQEWDGKVVVVRPAVEAGSPTWPAAELFPEVADPERRLTAAAAVGPPAVVVADQWGQIHLAREAGDEHAFPTVSELVSELRYLSIRCPECEGEAL